MLIVLLGPPGAGKGTQAERVATNYNLAHVSTGDSLREAVKSDTALGRKAKEYMDQGLLVPDELVVDIVRERLQQPGGVKGALLDGFPRTVAQAEFLEQMLSETSSEVDLVLLINVDDDELVNRLTKRRTCGSCGSNFHVKFKPPSVRNVCDQCGGDLYQREDDRLETVLERLKVYRQQTEPLVDYYGQKGRLSIIDGGNSIEKVYKQIEAVLQGI